MTRHDDIMTDPYANAVLSVLVSDFPQLRDFTVANVVRKQIWNYRERGGHLEVIVDDPYLARWRLIGAGGVPGGRRVYLGCWQTNISSESQERLDRLNAALDALETGG